METVLSDLLGQMTLLHLPQDVGDRLGPSAVPPALVPQGGEPTSRLYSASLSPKPSLRVLSSSRCHFRGNPSFTMTWTTLICWALMPKSFTFFSGIVFWTANL